MKTAIRYYSRTGNTKKLADAIAQTVGVPAQTVDVPLDEEVDVLFLGSAVYAAGVDQRLKDFIAKLDPAKVKNVVCFSTAALLPSTYGQVSKMLTQKGIPVDRREFHCRGRFQFAHKNRPNAEDLAAVKLFAQEIQKAPARQ